MPLSPPRHRSARRPASPPAAARCQALPFCGQTPTAARRPAPTTPPAGGARRIDRGRLIQQPARPDRGSHCSSSSNSADRSLCRISGSLCAAARSACSLPSKCRQIPGRDDRRVRHAASSMLADALRHQPGQAGARVKAGDPLWALSTTVRIPRWSNWSRQYWWPAPLCASRPAPGGSLCAVRLGQRAIQRAENDILRHALRQLFQNALDRRRRAETAASIPVHAAGAPPPLPPPPHQNAGARSAAEATLHRISAPLRDHHRRLRRQTLQAIVIEGRRHDQQLEIVT